MADANRGGHAADVAGAGSAGSTDLRRVARDVFGWPRLRPAQEQAMAAVLAGRDVLAVMATGSGKSAIYQVPGVLLDGATLVISPLIALQQDQICGLEAREAPEAVAINSLLDSAESDRAWRALRQRAAEYVFLAPEQLAHDEVMTALSGAGISLVVVDEAHCVSSWGHDFRPDYLRVADAIARLGHPTVVALTATASPPVRAEIVEQLGLRDPLVIASGFDRPNIRLEVSRHVTDDEKRDAVLAAALAADRPALLYTATRADAESYAAQLVSRKVKAVAYHAGRSRAEREDVHARFRSGEVAVVAATSAFGMGIDKADVRAVIHAAVPDSVDTYYQQIGRAGRDGKPAVAQLFYRAEDLGLARFFSTAHLDGALVATVYSALRQAGGPLGRKQLARGICAPGRRITLALNTLEEAGLIRCSAEGFGVREAVSLEAAASRAAAVVERRERVDRTRVEMMRRYAECRDCRRQFLLSYFGETLPGPCGNCDRCDANAGAAAGPAPGRWAVDAPVTHRLWGRGLVMDVDDDRITVLFDEYGYRTLLLESIEASGILQPGSGAVSS